MDAFAKKASNWQKMKMEIKPHLRDAKKYQIQIQSVLTGSSRKERSATCVQTSASHVKYVQQLQQQDQLQQPVTSLYALSVHQTLQLTNTDFVNVEPR